MHIQATDSLVPEKEFMPQPQFTFISLRQCSWFVYRKVDSFEFSVVIRPSMQLLRLIFAII